MSNQNHNTSVEEQYGSFPVPLKDRTWGPWLAAAVCATAAIATWSLVVGGFTASYVGAQAGTSTMVAGALIVQMLVSLSQLPPNTKHGLETVVTTKPQLGVRGSYIALIIQFAVLTGWNLVLMIFFGRSVAAVLVSAGWIAEASSGTTALVASVGGALLVWALLTVGSKALRYLAPAIAIMVVGIAIWMLFVLFGAYPLSEIAAAPPLAPTEGGPLMNYTLALEVMMVSTMGWWAYMGGMLRMVSSASKAAMPSMASLGFGWAAVGLISLYSALVTGKWDPTVWMIDLGGPAAGAVVLAFIALANIGSTLVGVHAATLGVGQVPFLSERIRSWGLMAGIVIIPMIVVLILFPGPFYDNIGIFLAFVGILIAPVMGVQIVDWFVFNRDDHMHIPSLYRHNSTSEYWYTNGFNVAGIVGLIAGGAVYVAFLNPYTFVPRIEAFQYVTATLPATLTGGLVYWGLSVALAPRGSVPAVRTAAGRYSRATRS
ncbi:MAG TPA: cytosine permease [Gammaproteobacteria bacterium]|nr:cytosine permease [Gammaproteobacteria bacterium]